MPLASIELDPVLLGGPLEIVRRDLPFVDREADVVLLPFLAEEVVRAVDAVERPAM
jgi:hypothetical protein